jgi:hypothetical protein
MDDRVTTNHREHSPTEASERIAEIGEILTLGLVRLRARQSSEVSADSGESSLACVAHQSGHRNTELEKMG